MKKSITTLDLNLLLCLQLLMQERSVTKAAKRMNVTPSAVSKSLAKLRAWFDDPLFVNSPLGLSPTPLMVSVLIHLKYEKNREDIGLFGI